MMQRIITLLRLLLVSALVGLAAFGCGDDSDGTVTRPGDGSYLDIALPTIDDGEDFRLADLRGRPAVVNFFASWCTPCVTEMPDIEQVKQDFRNDIMFVGIDVEDSRDDGRKLIERTGITWQVARDPDGELVRAVRGIGMPTTILLDADGNIVEHRTGAINRKELQDLIIEHFDVEPKDGGS